MKKPQHPKSQTTVGQLIRELQSRANDKPVMFGGSPDGLIFNRVKERGDYVQIEFNQQVYRDSTGKIVVEEREPS